MFNLRNVSFPTMLAGGGFGTVGVVFGSTLITHPIAGGMFLGITALSVAKVQQHSADKREAKAAKAVEEAKAKAIEAAKAEQQEHDREVAEFLAQNAPQAVTRAQPAQRPMVINQTGDVVRRHAV